MAIEMSAPFSARADAPEKPVEVMLVLLQRDIYGCSVSVAFRSKAQCAEISTAPTVLSAVICPPKPLGCILITNQVGYLPLANPL